MTKEFVAFTRLDASDVNTYLVNRPLQNAIINGAFDINQRNFTSATATSYTFDRFQAAITNGGGSVTVTPQTFTPGAAPISGYEATNFLRIAVASQSGTDSRAAVDQNIENTRTFAGETITASFFARAATGTPNIVVNFQQTFGSGGSPIVITTATKQAISTSWNRYSFTVSLPSVSGKTIGANSYLRMRIWVSSGSDNNSITDNLGIQNNTFDIWGVQLEAGTVANPFRRNANSIQGELAACQRYYYRTTSENSLFALFGVGKAINANTAQISINLPVTMRVNPTSIDNSAVSTFLLETGQTGVTSLTTITLNSAVMNKNVGQIDIAKSGAFTTGAFYWLLANNSTSSFIGFSAEL
jgi:hypothetical protein